MKKSFKSFTTIKNSKKQCSRCNKWKPLSAFGKHAPSSNGLMAGCKICLNEENRKRDKIYNKRYNLQRLYNITLETYNELLKNQKYCCAICGVSLDNSSRKRVPHVDHDHLHNRIRGLLCGHCNIGLGHFYDNEDFLKSAIIYLEKNNDQSN